MFNKVEQGENLNKKNVAEIENRVVQILKQKYLGDNIMNVNMRDGDILIGKNLYQLKYIPKIEPNFVKLQVKLLINDWDKAVVFNEYINRNICEQLKNNNIMFADAAGNVFLKGENLYIYAIGNRPEKALNTAEFQKMNTAMVKLVLILLIDENILNMPYREIAERAGIGYGGLTGIINQMKHQNFIIDVNERKRLINKEKLFRKWAFAFIDNLVPQITIGRYRTSEPWNELKGVEQVNAEWGGEPAAYMMGKYIKPKENILYIDENKYIDFIKMNRIVKDNKGTLILRKKFWKTNYNNKYVNPYIVYADLMANGDQRDEETAEKIYEKYINKHLR